eukprot:SAG11_NODE_1396_length_5036_cov_2.382824_9_plen_182_part_00
MKGQEEVEEEGVVVELGTSRRKIPAFSAQLEEKEVGLPLQRPPALPAAALVDGGAIGGAPSLPPPPPPVPALSAAEPLPSASTGLARSPEWHYPYHDDSRVQRWKRSTPKLHSPVPSASASPTAAMQSVRAIDVAEVSPTSRLEALLEAVGFPERVCVQLPLHVSSRVWSPSFLWALVSEP